MAFIEGGGGAKGEKGSLTAVVVHLFVRGANRILSVGSIYMFRSVPQLGDCVVVVKAVVGDDYNFDAAM